MCDRYTDRKYFDFYDPGQLIDRDLELVLIKKVLPEFDETVDVPAYKFEMRVVNSKQKIGRINFRIGNTEDLIVYAGHLGFAVEPKFRGNRYAARSCQLLFPLAKKYQINPIWITCNPDNTASRRTCEIAGGKLIEIVDLPPENDQYQDGERRKCRYRFDISIK